MASAIRADDKNHVGQPQTQLCPFLTPLPPCGDKLPRVREGCRGAEERSAARRMTHCRPPRQALHPSHGPQWRVGWERRTHTASAPRPGSPTIVHDHPNQQPHPQPWHGLCMAYVAPTTFLRNGMASEKVASAAVSVVHGTESSCRLGIVLPPPPPHEGLA